MKKTKQLSFFQAPLKMFGGSLLHGKRRSQRPYSSKQAMHLVLRSSWATGSNSFLQAKHKNRIHQIIQTQSKKFGVRIYRYAVVGNHLHFVLRLESRKDYPRFIRALTGLIAMQVMRSQSFKNFRSQKITENRTDAGDGLPALQETQGKGQAFWQFRPFTRVLNWGRDYGFACAYVVQNELEALGFIAFKPRKNAYKKWIEDLGIAKIPKSARI